LIEWANPIINKKIDLQIMKDIIQALISPPDFFFLKGCNTSISFVSYIYHFNFDKNKADMKKAGCENTQRIEL